MLSIFETAGIILTIISWGLLIGAIIVGAVSLYEKVSGRKYGEIERRNSRRI